MNPIALTCGNHEIPLKYKPNARAKRLSLRLSAKEAAFVLTVPPRATLAQIMAFLQHCTPWAEQQVQKLSKLITIQPGKEVFLYGVAFQCVTDPLRRCPVLCEGTQILHLPPQYARKDLHGLLKGHAEKILTPLLIKAATALGKSIERITIRDTKTQWGSCSTQKTISLNWRLILAPPDVAHYVCIHEAAHLLYMNHSKAFWETVRDLCPTYRLHRAWLKAHGPSLMGV